MDPKLLLSEHIYVQLQSEKVFTQAQLLIFREQFASFKTITKTLSHLREEAHVEQQLHELVMHRQAAAAAKRPRAPQQPTTSPTAFVKTPMACNTEPRPMVVDDDEVDTPPASDRDEDAEEEEEASTDDDRDSNLATSEEEANTDDFCDDGSDEEPRKRGRRRRVSSSPEVSQHAPTATDDEHSNEEEDNTQHRVVARGVDTPAAHTPAVLCHFTKPVRWPVPREEDQACDVCGDVETEESNAILLCDGCDIAVHQACYGITNIPEGDWFCDGCAAGLEPMGMHCAVCPVVGGALRKVVSLGPVHPPPPTRRGPPPSTDNLWVHAACALWNSEITFGNPETLSYVRLDGLSQERVALQCAVCGQQGGGVMQCGYASCATPFHVLCGRAKGLVMEFKENDGDLPLPMGFCARHSAPRFESGRKKALGRVIFNEDKELAQLDEGRKRAGGVSQAHETSEYEIQRQKNMARNAQKLQSLLAGSTGEK